MTSNEKACFGYNKEFVEEMTLMKANEPESGYVHGQDLIVEQWSAP